MMESRRKFLYRSTGALGMAAAHSLLAADGGAELPHFPPTAKRVICLFMFGGPSQIDLFDYKPALNKLHGTDLPPSIRQGQRLTAMTATQASFPLARSIYEFRQYGQAGAGGGGVLPHTAAGGEKICFFGALPTGEVNYQPGVTF